MIRIQEQIITGIMTLFHLKGASFLGKRFFDQVIEPTPLKPDMTYMLLFFIYLLSLESNGPSSKKINLDDLKDYLSLNLLVGSVC